MTVRKEQTTGQLTLPTHPNSTSEEICAYLRHMQRNIEDLSVPYVYPAQLAFRDASDARRWQDEIGALGVCDLCVSVQTLWAARKHGKKAWFGLCTVPAPVVLRKRAEAIANHTWHAVAFGIIAREKGGKALLVYDCDVGPTTTLCLDRPRQVLGGVMLRLHKHMRSKGPVELWVNKHDPRIYQRGRCLELSLRKLRQWVSYGDGLFQGSSDERVKGEWNKIVKA
ncbi:hypothetical protein TARUN_10224 [Trichoderma arundinaceum]|uniref:Uncharacterized protein n=1 Tax=Trichoderma arundinaceum TaxID=490622 RepID=A0A395N8A3_TRIAR|nr:hypothetical protein TARUN_10224 [Trichoderma arundinaceum]